MYTFQINPWNKPDIAVHTSTVWEIYNNKECQGDTGLIERNTTTAETGSLSTYTTNLVVPAGSKYFIKATRKFEAQPQIDHSLTPVEIKATNIDIAMNNNIINADITRVDTPYIYVNEEEYRDPNRNYFTVRTSKFRSGQDGHVATHWIITDTNDNVLFSRLNEVIDLLEIQIDKTMDIQQAGIFIIRAIHVTTNQFESEAGMYIFQDNNFGFGIKGLLTDVPPYVDLNLMFTPENAVRDGKISAVYFKNINDDGEVIGNMSLTINKDKNYCTIPGAYLKYGARYYLDVYGYDNKGNYTTRRYNLETARANFDVSFNADNFELKSESSFEHIEAQQHVPVVNYYTTFQLPTGEILIPSPPKPTTNLLKHTLTPPNVVVPGSGPATFNDKYVLDLKTENIYGGISLPAQVVQDGFYCRLFNNRLLLIDSKNAGSQPEFSVYVYDPVTKSVTAAMSDVTGEKRPVVLTRVNENSCVGNNNTVIQISPSEVIYLPDDNSPGTRHIKKFNLETGAWENWLNISTTAVPNPQDDALKLNTLFNVARSDRYSMLYNRKRGMLHLFITGDGKQDLKLVVINVKDKQILDVIDFTNKFPMYNPAVDGGTIIKPVDLPNGDYLLYNIGGQGGKVVKEAGVVYYDCEEDTYTPIPVDVDYTAQGQPGYKYNGTISILGNMSYLITTQLQGTNFSAYTRVY